MNNVISFYPEWADGVAEFTCHCGQELSIGCWEDSSVDCPQCKAHYSSTQTCTISVEKDGWWIGYII